jgi:hypothetical protein
MQQSSPNYCAKLVEGAKAEVYTVVAIVLTQIATIQWLTAV